MSKHHARDALWTSDDDRILIGLDVDGVLYRWGRSVRRAIRERYGIVVPEDEWFGEEHVAPDMWAWVWSDSGVRNIFGKGDSFPGAVRAAQRLCQIGDVRIMTACPKAAHNVRKKWLDSRRIPYSELCFIDPPPANSGVGTDGKSAATKSSILPHCDVYIDDNSRNCDELVQNTAARVILVSHSWNQKGEIPKSRSKRLVRLDSWDTIIKEVEEVARAKQAA